MNVRDNKDAAGNSNNLRDDTVSVLVNVTDVNEHALNLDTTQTAISVAENQTSVLTYMPQWTRTTSNNQANDSSQHADLVGGDR